MDMISICARNKNGDFKDNIIFMKKTQNIYMLQKALEQNPDVQISIVSCKPEYDGRLYINQYLKFANLINIFATFTPNLEFVLDVANEMAINSLYRDFVYKRFSEELERRAVQIAQDPNLGKVLGEDKLLNAINTLTDLVKGIIQENVYQFEKQSGYRMPEPIWKI